MVKIDWSPYCPLYLHPPKAMQHHKWELGKVRYARPPRWENDNMLAKWKLSEAGILSVKPPTGSHLDVLELGRWVTTGFTLLCFWPNTTEDGWLLFLWHNVC